MRFSTKHHHCYCGIELPARTRSLCILHQAGAILGHRPLPAGPAPFRNVIAPSREALGVCVACLFPWDGLAALWARAGLPCVRGPALSRQALPGGQAQHETRAAQTSAVLVRGGLLPPAYVEPAALRATRDRRRRRRPRRRQRAARLAPIHKTPRQAPRPESGKPLAAQAHRAGVAARVPAPAVQTSLAGALARLDHSDQWLRAVARSRRHPATPHAATTLDRRRTVPGSSARLSRGRREAIPALQRCPRGPECVSYGRRVQGAKDAAGQRSGTAGPQLGTADRTWACSAAAGVCRRHHPPGPQ